MYTGLIHSHRLFVILFLLLYLVKLVILIRNKPEMIEKFAAKTRIPEMAISALFLLTGIGLLFMVAQITPLLLVKIALVLASIPIAIIGFRNKNKMLASLSVLLIILAYGLSEMNKLGVSNAPLAKEIVTKSNKNDYDQLAHGLALYERNCQVCHGENGKLGGSGAKDLTTTKLTGAEQRTLLQNGKNAMPAYEGLLDADEMAAVLTYVKTLHE